MIRLGSQRIDIPAGANAYVTSDRYALPVDVDLLAVQPHAHNLARSIKGYAQLPDGRREWLIDIVDWDFRWQDVYRYAAPVHLPRGTVLEVQYTYDNPAPTREIRIGRRAESRSVRPVLPKWATSGSRCRRRATETAHCWTPITRRKCCAKILPATKRRC